MSRRLAEVAALRRYPVKSMAGEALDAVPVDDRGLAGDRWYAVEDEDGRFASGKDTRRFRRRDPVLAYGATTQRSGDVWVTHGHRRWPVGDPSLDAELSRAMGLAVRVTTEADVPHQDDGSVSLVGTATLDWCARRWGLDADARRLRVNVVLATQEPFVEETWVGRTLAVGGAGLRVVDRTPRCRMIDIEQDGVAPVGRWLKPLAAERGTCLAVYADVVGTGLVQVGDPLGVAEP